KTHKALGLMSVPRGGDMPDAVVQPDELSHALTDWALQLLEGVEIVMPGTAPKVLKDATREHRYVLQAAGFYGRLPWPVTWGRGRHALRRLHPARQPRRPLPARRRDGGARRRLLEMVAGSEWTVVMFEAPNRVAELLADLARACGGERRAAVARELTKVFEETRDGTLEELAEYYAEAPARGEVTVIVA